MLRVKLACQVGAVFVILQSPTQVHSLKFKVQLQFLNQLVRGKSSGLNTGSLLKNTVLITAVLKNVLFLSKHFFLNMNSSRYSSKINIFVG